MIDETRKMQWGSVDKERKELAREEKNRAADIRDRIQQQYGLDFSLPPPGKSRGKKDRRKQAGFKSNIRDYGGWR